MKISKKDVEYVARLARLELTEKEKDTFTEQLGSILDYIDRLNRQETADVPPTSHVLDLKNVWREDEVRPCPEEVRRNILANSPDREDDLFKVKKVIE